MKNGFQYVKYIQDAAAKHTGGTCIPYVLFDSEYFKDKRVILFDDIYTTGKTMALYAKILESIGADIIGGITIGNTQRDKEEELSLGCKGLLQFFSWNVW